MRLFVPRWKRYILKFCKLGTDLSDGSLGTNNERHAPDILESYMAWISCMNPWINNTKTWTSCRWKTEDG